jgi:SAM-dependent methyltransferase
MVDLDPYDPIAAYDRIAPMFGSLAEQRMRYLDAVDQIVTSHIPIGSRSLLDVGTGDGRRALRIAEAVNLTEIVLLEPSQGMQRRSATPAPFRTLRAEQLDSLHGRFDVIVCLWNVLGHVFPHAARAEAMRQFARLALPRGRIFVDVNHRYNAAHYGAARTAIRFLHDRIHPDEKNGDVVASWNVEGAPCSVRGHVFTQREFRSLTLAAGLTIEKRFVVDYATGQPRRFSFQGNLLYMLRPASTVVE